MCWAPYGMNEIHLIDRYAPPSWQYLLGADQLGRDILSRIIYGARISVVVGLSATSINLVVALLIGATSGFFGGKLDMVVQRFVDAWMAFPGLLILITVMSLVGQGQLQIILVLGIAGGISGSRIARSAVIPHQGEHVRAGGAGDWGGHRQDHPAPCAAQHHGVARQVRVPGFVQPPPRGVG